MIYDFKVKLTEVDNYIKIKGFPIQQFERDIKRRWETNKINNIYKQAFTWFSTLNTVNIHKFFLPEILYIFSQIPKRKIYVNTVTALLEKTWVRSTTLPFPVKIHLNKLNELKRTLKPYQLDFLNIYDQKVQQYRLNGYLNAFEQGLGKSFTAIALMHVLHKDKIIIIAPNNTVYDTWVNEIQNTFVEEQIIWTQHNPVKNAKWFIINYESIEKLLYLPELQDGSNIGTIIDEIHNFRNKNTNRSINAINLVKMTKSEDVLALSGTPIKALGSEMIPLLKLIDPFFDTTVEDIFKRTFGVASTQLSDIIANRLGLIMHRKLKAEVLDLPEKTEQTIPVVIPNGNYYTLPNLQGVVKTFISERTEFYMKNKVNFEEDYQNGLDYFEHTNKYDTQGYEEYLDIVKIIKNKKYKDWQDRIDSFKKANLYEKTVIEPVLPSEIKKRFHKAKSVVKYVEMVILGEVIGGLLPHLREQMYSEIIKYGPTKDIISGAIKKTIIFTTYTSVVEETTSLCKKWKYDPVPIYQKTAKDSTTLLKIFREQPTKNPLITTIQMMSTGVTLIEANTVIFAPTPFRYTDYLQASDRVMRIGQTDPCYIYTFILDTGTVPNLSTRIQEISDWSKDLFEKIVGTKVDTELVVAETKLAVESFGQDTLNDIQSFVHLQIENHNLKRD